MSDLKEHDPIELVNASLAIDKAGLQLIPLSRDGQPYPQLYHFHNLAKAKFIAIAPAGTRFKYCGENGNQVVIEGLDHCFATPAWNVRLAAG